MSLGLFSSGGSDEDLLQKLKSFAREIEHKFQQRRGYDLDPTFLDRISVVLQKLSSQTESSSTQRKIDKIEIRITAATRYYLDNKYEEYFERVKVIADELDDLD